MPRLQHVLVAGLAALPGLSCFAIEPLPDCSRQDGLYVAHHVCMPLARERLSLASAPRQLAVGDFDGDGSVDDLAILSDPDRVAVYTALDQPTPALRELSFTGGESTVAGFLAAPFLADGVHGDDLFAWVAPPTLGPGDIIALPNGGDDFAGEPIIAELRGVRLDDEGNPDDILQRACLAPNGGLALTSPTLHENPTEGAPTSVLIVTCVPDLALGGGTFETFAADQLPDAIAISSDLAFSSGLFGALIGGNYRSVGAAQLAQLHSGEDFIDFVFAHRPNPGADAELAIVHTTELDPGLAVSVQPRQGSIDQLRAADLDLDGDIDLLTIHLERNGFSIIRQQPADAAEELVFGEPEFYTLELELSDVVLGDFTGDGGLDIAVAHNIDNTSLDGLTVFALDREQPGGPVPYAAALIGYVEGAIVALRALDIDGDGRDDLAVAVRDGSKGYVNLYTNHSPGDDR